MLIQPDLLKLDYGLRSVGLEQTEEGQESQNSSLTQVSIPNASSYLTVFSKYLDFFRFILKLDRGVSNSTFDKAT